MSRMFVFASDDPLAGFPSNGLVALYKCDETNSSRLVDATGTYNPMIPHTGTALDCATQTQYIVDGTGLRGLLHGLDPLVVFGLEIVTPALASGTTQYLIGGTSTSAANAPGVQVYLTQASGLWDTADRYSLSVNCRMSVDGAAVSNNLITIGAGTGNGFKPNTGYQIVGKYTATVGSTTNLTVYYREGCDGEWKIASVTAGATPATSVSIVEGATSIYRVGCYGTATSPFKGALAKAFLAVGSVTVANLQTALLSEDADTIQGILGTNARFWHFRAGTGTTAEEYITEADVAITGTEAWGAFAGITQYGLRQGGGTAGKPGVVLGGETGATGVGKSAYTSEHATSLIGSSDGWTLVATFRVGDTLPAAERSIVSVYGPLTTGLDETDITKTPGIHLTYTAAGLIRARRKNTSVADGVAGSASNLGAGERSYKNGQFTTYAFSCDSTGALKARRMGPEDTSVVTESTVSASSSNLMIRGTRVRIGDPLLDCNCVVAYVGVYSREITNAEIAHIASRAAQMRGGAVWVDAAAAEPGNGTQRFPYASLQSALRVHQPAGTIYLNGGTANQRIASNYSPSSVLKPASIAGMTLIGTNSPVIIPGGLSDSTAYPLYLEANATATWIFHDVVFDAADASIVVGPGQLEAGGVAGAVVVLDGITRLEMYGCTTKNAKKASASSGTGLTSRAIENVIWDHISTDNGEHAAYFRVAAASPAVPHTFDVRRFTASGNAEDGIKCTNEFSDGSTDEGGLATREAVYWEDITLDRIHIDGGKNQILLDGVKIGTLTNFLCEGEDGALATTGGVSIGASYSYGQVELLTIANGTIRDYGGTHGYAVKNTNSTGCTITNVVTGNCFADLYDPAGTLTSSHCSGNSGHATLLWPTGNNNTPDASITFDGVSDAHISSGDGFEDGKNLTGSVEDAEVDLDGVARPTSGAWNRGAY